MTKHTIANWTIAALLGTALTASVAGTAAAAPADSPSHDHQMGASIRAHEGTGTGAAPRALTVQPQMAKNQTPGLDVSHWQGSVNWKSVASNGAKFAYIKATEGSSYRDPKFNSNYTGSYNAGLIRGAYHYARPDSSSGAAQAKFFVAHGGGWSKDGKTLPGALDVEYGSASQGGNCYGKSKSQMAKWIKNFTKTYKAKTSRDAVIYTSTSWWKQCVGTSAKLASSNPLWIARYNSSIGALPSNWNVHTIWQYDDSGSFPGDQDKFNGSLSRVKALANG
ncbi:lysozyme [Spelaeicoccus albus]|uniref:Lysozyme n=1 Tax=Spelaeicoccus albus TaxID=1280376 RepID=A0A7Z0D3J4_9MICO|nr:lysozyme [Spelaeicoccus albus]NYI68222.1 GH25 family lysozyme M1 (1,4-beta-N-acetylmuramidase) [Spelaeicoccus albus]